MATYLKKFKVDSRAPYYLRHTFERDMELTGTNELYKDFNIHVIEAKRNINANGKKRGKVEEVIITNFENKRGFE